MSRRLRSAAAVTVGEGSISVKGSLPRWQAFNPAERSALVLGLELYEHKLRKSLEAQGGSLANLSEELLLDFRTRIALTNQLLQEETQTP